MRRSFQGFYALAVSTTLLALAGCTGTSTYGTGKSQELQLLEDIGGIATIGAKKKKPRIDYMARPKLIKPTTTAALPTPAESTSDESGYFPTNPEEKRAVLLKQIEEAEKNGTELPEEVQAMRRASIVRPGDPDFDRSFKNSRKEQEIVENAGANAEKFAKRKAELRGARGAAPRRYLTEPPSTYRTPEQTAAVGDLGEKEKDPYQKRKSRFLDILSGRD